MAYDDYVALKSGQAVKEAGKYVPKAAGEYVVRDGDIILFRSND